MPDKYIVYRWIDHFAEIGGQFGTLKEARAYAKRCRTWGYKTVIYGAIEDGHA